MSVIDAGDSTAQNLYLTYLTNFGLRQRSAFWNTSGFSRSITISSISTHHIIRRQGPPWWFSKAGVNNTIFVLPFPAFYFISQSYKIGLNSLRQPCKKNLKSLSSQCLCLGYFEMFISLHCFSLVHNSYSVSRFSSNASVSRKPSVSFSPRILSIFFLCISQLRCSLYALTDLLLYVLICLYDCMSTLVF